MKRFEDCKYSAFISFAHADDVNTHGWISDFVEQLQLGVASKLARVPQLGNRPFPAVHHSGDGGNGPFAGDLDDELKSRIDASFAMVVVVHEAYLDSPWCRREIEYFSESFGQAGLDERLYILALSQSPMQTLGADEGWQRIFSGRTQVWQPFFAATEVGKPVRVLRDDGVAATNAFIDLFDPIRDDIAAKIASDVKKPAPKAVPARLVFGVATPELLGDVKALAARIADATLPVAVLEPSALLDGLAPFFTPADTLVLPFNQSQPLQADFVLGGHLAIQRNAWLKRGKPESQVLALDLTQTAPRNPADDENRVYLQQLKTAALGPEALVQRFRPSAKAETMTVPLYIESNCNERTEWQQIGDQIEVRWQEVLKARNVTQRLQLRPRGLVVDEIDRYPNLDEADGLVLLWGRKEVNSLLSQIDLVEKKLPGDRGPAPGVVAYLMPPNPDNAKGVPAYGWDVLRFHDQGPSIDIVPDDGDGLTIFLNRMLKRASRRHGIALA